MKHWLILLVVCVASCVGEARAADVCLSLPQARVSHPGKYLVYHLDSGHRCWTPKVRSESVRHRGYPQTPPVPATPRVTTYWPALASVVIVVDAVLLTPEPATAWPRLLDIDEATADDPLLTSYWPPLDEPGLSFSERWTELPSNWFALIGGMK